MAINGRENQLNKQDRAVHDWYRFVLSFPPHLVRNYIEKFNLTSDNVILDPFCGTGTTLVESKLNNIQSIGIEANTFAHFASSVKVDWSIDPDSLHRKALEIAGAVEIELQLQGINDAESFTGDLDCLNLRKLNPDEEKLLLTNSISPLPLHKSLTLLNYIHKHKDEPYYRHLLLSFSNALVFDFSNLHFGPEVGVRKPKKDVPVIRTWLDKIDDMVQDLKLVASMQKTKSNVFLADSRETGTIILPNSVDGVITSPPYPNEKDYTRTTRLESVLLGFIKDKAELRELKQTLIRSNTRNVYKADDDDLVVANNKEIQRISKEIEDRRIELGKTSGFERLYGRVTKLYFGGMSRHLASLRPLLRPGAQLAYVVGDQASYLRIMIRTGQLLAEIAESLGYKVVDIDLFRKRFASATKEELREEVVMLKWMGR
jgi:DNA modification methylase